MNEIKAPTSVWQGSFRVFGVDVQCHILDNGQRIIEADSLNQLFGVLPTSANMNGDDAELLAFARWQKGEPCPK